jgi:hypothetical protein
VDVRPELTTKRALAQIARRWWLLPVCMIAVTVAALALSGHHISNAKATQRVHVQDVSISYQFQGQPQPYTPVRTINDLSSSDFIDPQTAAAAAKTLGDGTTGQQITDGLGFAALSGSDIQLSYSDAGSEAHVQRVLNGYVRTLVRERIATERQALIRAAANLRANGGDQTAVARLQTAAAGLNQQIHPVGTIALKAPRTIPKPALIAAGLLAGLILGVLLALAFGQADPRIRTLADLRAAGVRAIPVEPGKPESVDALRAVAEVAGVDANGGVIAVVTPRAGKDDSVSRSLAESFAAAGRPTTWLSESGAVRNADGGWSQLGPPGGALRSLPQLREALSGGRPGEVVVIDAPALLDHPGSLVATAAATVTIVAVRRGRSTWGDLESSLELLDDAVVGGRVRICLDRGGRRADTPLLGLRTAQPAAETTA